MPSRCSYPSPAYCSTSGKGMPSRCSYPSPASCSTSGKGMPSRCSYPSPASCSTSGKGMPSRCSYPSPASCSILWEGTLPDVHIPPQHLVRPLGRDVWIQMFIVPPHALLFCLWEESADFLSRCSYPSPASCSASGKGTAFQMFISLPSILFDLWEGTLPDVHIPPQHLVRPLGRDYAFQMFISLPSIIIRPPGKGPLQIISLPSILFDSGKGMPSRCSYPFPSILSTSGRDPYQHAGQFIFMS